MILVNWGKLENSAKISIPSLFTLFLLHLLLKNPVRLSTTLIIHPFSHFTLPGSCITFFQILTSQLLFISVTPQDCTMPQLVLYTLKSLGKLNLKQKATVHSVNRALHCKLIQPRLQDLPVGFQRRLNIPV